MIKIIIKNNNSDNNSNNINHDYDNHEIINLITIMNTN